MHLVKQTQIDLNITVMQIPRNLINKSMHRICANLSREKSQEHELLNSFAVFSYLFAFSKVVHKVLNSFERRHDRVILVISTSVDLSSSSSRCSSTSVECEKNVQPVNITTNHNIVCKLALNTSLRETRCV